MPRPSPPPCCRHCARIPDVILVGELRDLETMSIAVTAAEMGILVMATLHTNGAAATVDRLVNAFPADKQPHVRTMLSTSLRGVVSQQLIPKADKQGPRRGPGDPDQYPGGGQSDPAGQDGPVGKRHAKRRRHRHAPHGHGHSGACSIRGKSPAKKPSRRPSTKSKFEAVPGGSVAAARRARRVAPPPAAFGVA